ncbi:MAG: response regulator [Chloroflexota bacterium]
MKKEAEKSILIVEDEPDIKRFARRVLELEGYRVNAVGDAETAWKELKKEKYSLLVLDLRLPGENGWALFEKVKADPQTSGMPVLVFSASASYESRKRAQELGAAGFLVKPVTAQGLVDAVAAILGKA